MKRTPAFTLVELSVAGSLLALLLGLTVGALVFSRSAARVDDLAGEIIDALQIQEQLTTDLFALAPVKSAPVRYWPDDASRLAFYVAEPGTDRPGCIAVRAVEWRFDSRTRSMMRDCAGRNLSVGSSPLVSVTFAPMDGPTGYLLRTSLSFAPRGPGRSMAYTFIARIPKGILPAECTVDILLDFPHSADAPADQGLPRL